MSQPDKNDQITVSVTYDSCTDYGAGGLSANVTVGPDVDSARMREVADVLTLLAAQMNARADVANDVARKTEG
jgi:hypothetical protein